MSSRLQYAIDTVSEALQAGAVPFSAWRRQEGYKSHDELYNHMMSNGDAEEEFDAVVEEVLAEYSAFCESYGVEEDMDEDY